MPVNLYVVRHGQTDHNLQGIIQGHLDTPLNDTGRRQAAAVAKALRRISFDYAFTSDSSRARDTALAILQEQESGSIELVEQLELRERDMGELSGTRGPVSRPMPSSVESSSAMCSRGIKWFKRAIIPLAKSDRELDVLVTSHGAYIITLFHMLVLEKSKGGLGVASPDGAPKMRHCGNTSVSIVRIENTGKGMIVDFDNQSHLERERDVLAITDAIPRPSYLPPIKTSESNLQDVESATSPTDPISPWPPHPPQESDRDFPRLPSRKAINGFIAVVFTYICYIALLLWGLVPLNAQCKFFEWLPDRQWITIMPAYSITIVLLTYFIYLGLMVFSTPNLNSLSMLMDGKGQIPAADTTYSKPTDTQALVEPYDAPISLVNRQFYQSRNRGKRTEALRRCN